MVHTDFRFDLVFIKRFYKLCRRMFPTFGSTSVLMTVFLLLLSLLGKCASLYSTGYHILTVGSLRWKKQVVIYNIGLIPSKYYKILGDKDRAGFTSNTILFVFIILSEAFLTSAITYVSSLLYITWREALCRALHKSYFSNLMYYYVNAVDKTIDNPDQRITQDVDILTQTFSKVFVPLIISPFKIGYYMYQASQVTGHLGPVSVVIFFIVFTTLNKLLMNPVVQYFFLQEKMEGDFRFKHMHLRVNAESAAFYHAAAIEEDKTNTKLHHLLATQKKLIKWDFFLKFCLSSADYLGSILSYIAIAFPIFYGHYGDLPPADMSSLISKNAFVSIYLINCFTTLMDQASSVTDVAGTAHRIGQLFEVLATLTEDQKEHRNSLCRPYSESFQEGSNSVREMTTRCAFEMEGVTYGPPKSSIVCCRGLTLQLKPNSNILVTGDSGCGKTSLIRIISGLWRSYQGSVNLGAGRIPQEIMYLPQKPYLTNGSLWDQIVFPSSETEVIPDDYKIYQYLSVVGLDPLVERIGGLDKDMDWNWHDELSPGEMQRLSFVRLFFHHPPFAILDEATSQVSEDMETILYQTCADLHITLLSVGHRNSIRRFHDFVLHISNDGGWIFRPVCSDHDDSRLGGGGDGEGSQSGHREQREGAEGGERVA